METQVPHQLLQTGSSPCFHIYLARLRLSEHEKILPLLIPGLTDKIGSSRALLQYQLLQGAWLVVE